MRKWKNIPCEFTIGLCDYAPEVSTDDDERVRVLDGRLVNENELVIKAKRSGYKDEGQWCKSNGDPGHAPEGNEAADLVEAYLLNGEVRTDLPQDVQNDLFEQFYDRIMDLEIDYDYHDYS